MAVDPDAKDLTVNYPGGSLTMTVGAFKSLFGMDTPLIVPIPEQKTVGVRTHPRTRVIGEPSSTVQSFTYEYTQWPTSQASNAAAGDVVLLAWEGSDGEWTGRVSGNFGDLGTFLNTNSLKPVVFRSERGTKYGSFNNGL